MRACLWFCWLLMGMGLMFPLDSASGFAMTRMLAQHLPGFMPTLVLAVCWPFGLLWGLFL